MKTHQRRALKRESSTPAVFNSWPAALRSLGLRVGMPLLTLTRLKAEDQVAYRHEWYQEHNGRVEVQAESFLVQKLLAPWLDLKIEGVYDAISGATPIGAPPPESITLRNPLTGQTFSGSSIRNFRRAGSADAVSGASPSGTVSVASASELPTALTSDDRWAGTIEAGLIFGAHRITPRFSYSDERDYISVAPGLNYAFQFNEKNTTLQLGWVHAYDRIIANADTFLSDDRSRDSDDFLAGVTQLLGPETVLTVSGSFGYGHGYFNDPYKGVIFEDSMLTGPARDTIMVYEEHRPGQRRKEGLYLSLTQAVTPLKASVEGSYRFYHDSFGIHAHTVTLVWFQKVGSWLVLSPSFRFYRQEAADFYDTQFSGHPIGSPGLVPEFYSSDYRLSALDSFAYGIQATIKLKSWLALEASYQRYDLRGRDGVTAQAAYPTADIVTGGLRVWF